MGKNSMAGPPSPSPSPSPSPLWAPSSSPTTLTTPTTSTSSSAQSTPPPSSNGGVSGVDFSPPLIAMVVVVAAAFLLVTYSRLLSRHLILLLRRSRRWWRRRRRRRFQLPSYSTTFSNLGSPPFPFDSSSPDAAAGFHVYSPYGLDDSVIKTIPLSVFNLPHNGSVLPDCAVCLLEFEENDYVRTLPACFHPFHVDCIDIWLRSHANCPLCRAGIFLPDSSPFVPVMSARIRPSLDDAVLVSLLDEANRITPAPAVTQTVTEISPCVDEASSPRRNSLHNYNGSYSEDNRDNINRLLKRSYSFGFERSSFLTASERMLVTEPATASPWRFRRGSGFWSKRPLTPFKSRVFSLRYHRGGTIMKSPAFFRRRSIGGGGGTFFPLSERFSTAGGGGSSSSRRSKSMASPMFLRSSVAAFSSSRLRCGDPEALLSPERFNRRG